MYNCLKYLIEKIKYSKNEEEPKVKYIPLQNIICDPLEYEVTRCWFIAYKQDRNIAKERTEQIKKITLSKDCILLGDEENLKYDYILNISTISSKCFRINLLGDVNIHDGRMHLADNLATIVIKLEDKKTHEFIKNLMIYITSYKKYNSFDKSVFGFKTFKKYYKK